MLALPSPVVLKSCSSTNVYIQKHPQKFMHNFQAVRCQQQDLGKGRQNRSWQMLPYKDLALSFVYYPTVLSNIPSYTLTVGLAVAHALDGYIENHFLKWPNDIWAKEGKLCGILIEQVSLNQKPALVIGIGINVNSSVKKLGFPNISLFELTKKEISLDELTKVLLHSMQIYLNEHRFPFDEEKISMWNLRCHCMGKKILVSGGIGAEVFFVHEANPKAKAFTKDFSATVLGIDEYGRLLVQKEQQKIALQEGHIQLLTFTN